jgi:hypothetical protein
MHNYFKSQGLKNPYRIKRLISQAVDSLRLDLNDLIVLTEAASKNYVVTPILAAIGGAKKVYAITGDSRYGESKEIAEFTYRLAKFCKVRDKIEVIFEKRKEVVEQADIITNLGFVRPINKALIEMMKENAVIPLMCEVWEYRKEDVDLEACCKKGIPVIGTNEEHPALKIFDFCGNLCLKMLFELEIEVYKNKIAVISSDKFGTVIQKWLKTNGAIVGRFRDLKDKKCREFIKESDALIVADYTSSEIFIGNNGQITADELRDLAPGISVLQFSGDVEVDELSKAGIPYFPSSKIGPRRMGVTLANLGPKPVIDLHAAGFKVGELAARKRLKGLSGNTTESQLSHFGLVQLLNDRV